MRLQGTVREWKNENGYGFIQAIVPTDTGSKYKHFFVHRTDTALQRCLSPGDLVEFEIGQDDTGRKRAVRVKVIQAAKTAA